MIIFPYFEDPENFSYVTDGPGKCEICGNIEVCFDTAGYYGSQAPDAVCPSCLKDGKLIELDAAANDIPLAKLREELRQDLDVESHANLLAYCTPKVPTWQDADWPIRNGDFCKFIKIASRRDFSDKHELFEAIPVDYHFGRNADEFWEMIPDAKITSLKNGNYDISFYLYMSGEQKVVLWDCN